MEERFCQKVKKLGCTCVTISHRPALMAFHDIVLALDGEGGWSLHRGARGLASEEHPPELTPGAPAAICAYAVNRKFCSWAETFGESIYVEESRHLADDLTLLQNACYVPAGCPVSSLVVYSGDRFYSQIHESHKALLSSPSNRFFYLTSLLNVSFKETGFPWHRPTKQPRRGESLLERPLLAGEHAASVGELHH